MIRPRLVRVVRALAMVVVQLTIVAVVAELGIRLMAADDIDIFPRYHSKAQYGDFTLRRLRPDTVFWHTSVDGSWRFETNARGFRDHRNFPYEKAPGTIRVVVLGDSQMEGMEARQDYTLSAALERYLNGAGVKAEVINTGVSGFSVAEELALLENEAIRYEPDFVVLALYANDFQDNIKSGLFSLNADGQLVVEKYSHIPGVSILDFLNQYAVIRWLSENSYLYSAGLNAAWETAKRALTSRTRQELITEYALSDEKDVDDYETALLAKLVERMFTFCAERNVGLILIDIPTPSLIGEVHSSIPETLRPSLQMNSDAYLGSDEVFKEYKHLGELHVPHGDRHISEFAHQILALETGRSVLALMEERRRHYVNPRDSHSDR